MNRIASTLFKSEPFVPLVFTRAMSSKTAHSGHKGIGLAGRFLQGKSALVTGSTSGIGLGVARALAAHGANITLNGLAKENEVADLIDTFKRDFNVKVEFDGADLSKGEEVRALIQRAQKNLGVDILVNNAGIQYISNVQNFPESAWDRIIAINLSAVFHSTKAALPQMLENKWGRIVNISSVHGLVASVNKSAYIASKHGVVGFTKATALETAGSGVTVNCVNPGWVLTPLVQAQIDLRAKELGISAEEARLSLLSEKQPSKQFVTVDDLGNFICFLSSEYANQMTGSTYVMDGGWTAQ